MPLTFNSLSHGPVAFGFFNIESDMLLLEHYFFFSTAFCEFITQTARTDPSPPSWPGYAIHSREDIGDLMGAIHAIHFTGFIGALYRQFPFPEDPADFKQNPEGTRTQRVVAELIGSYAETAQIPFSVYEADAEIAMGEFRFTRSVFHEILNYVWCGGYPRWKNNVRPGHVRAMKNSISQSGKAIFKDLCLDD